MGIADTIGGVILVIIFLSLLVILIIGVSQWILPAKKLCDLQGYSKVNPLDSVWKGNHFNCCNEIIINEEGVYEKELNCVAGGIYGTD